MITEDDVAWFECDLDDLWIFDKLILSRKLGYSCGPVDSWVPKPDWYIVRPISNFAGMGRDAIREFIRRETTYLPAGHFWCEEFKGRHLSVDYIDKEQVLATEGFKDNEDGPLFMWSKWKKIKEHVPYPKIVDTLKGDYRYINCEFIGDKLIEVHLRLNTDMGDYNEIIPMWESDRYATKSLVLEAEGWTWHEDKDYKRLGFWKK